MFEGGSKNPSARNSDPPSLRFSPRLESDPTLPKLSTSERGYGRSHQRARAELQRLVAEGTAFCSRCGQLIRPGQEWHLDHRDDRLGYRGAAHASCNVGAANRRRAKSVPPMEAPPDDPARGIYWGPPDEFGVRRWSRLWYQWR
jgi:hypothetical protein